MKTARYISVLLNTAYILAVFLFVSDASNIVEIKNQLLKQYAYYGFLLLSPLVFIINYIIYKSKKKRLKALIIPFIAILFTLYTSPLKIIFSASVWKTVKVISKENNTKTMELQQQDMGALGYNTRTVEVTYLTPLFMITKKIE